MDIHRFKKTLRRLEPTLSDFMLTNLFERLGNKDGKVEVENMVLNLSGTTHQTVDYKLKMLKDLYTDIF